MYDKVMEVTRFHVDAIIPTRGSPGAAGYDLYALEDFVINQQAGRGIIRTGIGIHVPKGTYGRIAPRSGLAVKKGIDVGAGVIDEDYTGEVKVLLFNFGDFVYEGKKGDRIAQLIIEKIETPEIIEVDNLETTERGEGGFGSTGK